MDSNRYYLTTYGIDGNPLVEVDFSIIDQIKKSMNILAIIRTIEEQYDIVVGNYKELLKEIFEVTIDNNLYSPSDIIFLHEFSRKINIRLLNFLNSAKMYQDHLHASLLKIDNTKGRSYIQRVGQLKKQNISICILEALRNHIQHYGIPTFTSEGTKRITRNTEDIIVHYLLIIIEVEYFKKDKKVRDTIPKEILSQNIELNSHIKEYFSYLSNEIEEVRQLFIEEYSSSTILIDRMIEMYSKVYPEIMEKWQKILCIIRNEENSYMVEFNRNNIDLIEKLRSRNKKGINLINRFFTDFDTLALNRL
ncbi:hypothetical protein SPIROBIBN47_50096 [uncultured spirochete]|uniref:Uncharacterized protein n=1 Tax=uncultured spirochete TaxID=156406 RepID=A0A3P3XLQ6_9SPIR|nr:hypothetical protein SPIROBIBN47_50096 [uncultured spirochete]